jgi:catechol 2,3-dioxygenase-like lactoylglutathione lyase family enzyme
MLGITRINHTAFRIDDNPEQLQQFYTETLGVPSVPRDLPEELQQVIPGFWLQLDATQVHFIQAPASDQPRNPLAAHLAFYVKSLDHAVAELKRLEIAYDQYDQLVFFSDPAGNTVELQQDPK